MWFIGDSVPCSTWYSPFIFPGPFKRDHIARVGHHADGLLVSRPVGADRAGFGVRQVLAAFAGERFCLGIPYRIREALRILFWAGRAHGTRALRGLLSNAGEPREFLDQLFDRRREKSIRTGRRPDRPCRPSLRDIWLLGFSGLPP